jgi:hypothetical protein
MVVRHSSAGELALALDHMGGQGGQAVGRAGRDRDRDREAR